jgi:tellurite resistance protein TerC
MALLVLPGPAIIVIPVGLTILATEFVWARTILKKVKNGMRSISEGIKK